MPRPAFTAASTAPMAAPLVAAMVTLLPAAARSADITTLSDTQYWRTYTTVSSEGVPLCGTVTRLDNGGSFYIKWFKGQRFLTVQVFKRGWAIPAGVEAPLRLRFPESEPWVARSSRLQRAASFLEFYIQPDKALSFTHDFTASPAMRLEFGSGDEQPWTMSLAGSTSAMSSLLRCIETVAGTDEAQPFAAGQPTQPFAPPGPATQPFSSQPSQPFAPQPGPSNSSPGRPKQFEHDPGDIND